MKVTGGHRDGGSMLRVYIQPRSSSNRVCGLHGDALKVAVTAPPVEGKANKAVIAFFAKAFQVRKQDISIRTGEQSRTKTLFFRTLEEHDLLEKIHGLAEPGKELPRS